MPDTHIYSSANQLYNKIHPFVIRNTEIIITGSEIYIFLLSAISISYNVKISTPDKYLSRICFFNAFGIFLSFSRICFTSQHNDFLFTQ